MTTPVPLYVILVSGRPEGQGGALGTHDTFARCAWLRVVELVKRFYRARKTTGSVVETSPVLRFIQFASHDSSVGIYEHDFATMKDSVRDANAKSVHRNWRVLDESFTTAFGPLTPAQDPKNFVEWKPVRAAKAAQAVGPNVSVVNVYHSVRKAPAGSVLEVSFFCHSFIDGPVLNNTEGPPTGSTTRAAGDTDGRANIDFLPNMGETGTANAKALDEFRAAFAAQGSLRIWGCNIQDIVETVPPEGGAARRCLIMSTVLQVEQALLSSWVDRNTFDKFMKTLPPGNTTVELDMAAQIGNELSAQADPHAGHAFTPFPRDRLFQIRYDELFNNHAYHAFFRGEKNSAGKHANSITRTLSDIVKFVAAETAANYFFIAAKELKTVTVMGGAPGTSAEVTDGKQQFIAPGRRRQAIFFSKFFDVPIKGREQRAEDYFVEMDNQGKAVKKILDCKTNGLP